MQLQTDMWLAKRKGVVEIDGLGCLSWMELIALADVMLGMIWTALTLEEQEGIFRAYAASGGFGDSIYENRHGSLRFLAWLIYGWPDSDGAAVGRQMLRRWLSADRNRISRHLDRREAPQWTAGPSNFQPPIKERLEALAGMSCSPGGCCA
jgi:hypothetical protein